MRAELCGTHREVRQRYLRVQGHCHHVADHKKSETSGRCRYGLVHDNISKPIPEKNLASNFEPSMPPGRSLLRALTKDEVYP